MVLVSFCVEFVDEINRILIHTTFCFEKNVYTNANAAAVVVAVVCGKKYQCQMNFGHTQKRIGFILYCIGRRNLSATIFQLTLI